MFTNVKFSRNMWCEDDGKWLPLLVLECPKINYSSALERDIYNAYSPSSPPEREPAEAVFASAKGNLDSRVFATLTIVAGHLTLARKRIQFLSLDHYESTKKKHTA